jgi:hypothetical protein
LRFGARDGGETLRDRGGALGQFEPAFGAGEIAAANGAARLRGGHHDVVGLDRHAFSLVRGGREKESGTRMERVRKVAP